MKASRFHVRELRDSDLPKTLSLIRDSLGPDAVPWNAEYWRWKHRQNPFGPSLERVAVAGDRIVGVRSFLRWELMASGRRVSCARPADTVTHPDWRRMGVFTELGRDVIGELERGETSLVFTLPNEAGRAANLRRGWSTVGRVPYAVKWMRPLRILYRHFFDTGDDGERTPPEQADLPRISGARDGEFNPVSDFLKRDGARHLIEKRGTRPRNRFVTPISLEYLEWRYADIPSVSYYACSRLGTSVEGSIIFRVTGRRGLIGLRVCEVFCDHSSDAFDLIRTLIRRAIDLVEPDYVLLVSPGERRYRWALYRMGFIPFRRSRHTLVARWIGDDRPGEPDPFSVGSWALPLGSYEIF